METKLPHQTPHYKQTLRRSAYAQEDKVLMDQVNSMISRRQE
jgi:hypothetical protein